MARRLEGRNESCHEELSFILCVDCWMVIFYLLQVQYIYIAPNDLIVTTINNMIFLFFRSPIHVFLWLFAVFYF